MGLPDLARISAPSYSPGLHVESSRDQLTFETVVDVSVSISRTVRISDEARMQHVDQDRAVNDGIEHAVRTMQDEAVRALGLQHWRTEIEREVRAAERRQRVELLRALANAVRNAPTTDRAALLVLDELEVLDDGR